MSTWWRRGVLLVSLVAALGSLVPVASAADGCRELADGVHSGASRTDCKTVQPGAGITFDGTLCTVGFVLGDPRGRRYAVTAGHCAQNGATATAEDGTTVVGRVVYREYSDVPFRDTLVVQLLPTASVRGRAQVLDGPHGTFEGFTSAPFALHHVGRGVGLSQVKDDRTGMASAATDPEIVHAQLVVSPNDSGSPVLTDDGRAVGWVTDIASASLADHSTDPPAAAAGWTVIRVTPVLRRASQALRTRLALVDA